jgi:hypothetical protein
MEVSAALLTPGMTLTGMSMFECGEFTTEECAYYTQRWHFWFAIFTFISYANL